MGYGLKVGIVGLPNTGKSTLFNALLKRQVSPEGNYPFTTVKPFTGVVEVPDERLEKLAELVARSTSGESHSTSLRASKPTPEVLKKPPIIPATVTFVDIAGLVKGAHKGEGLGNEFLGYIREADVLVHVIRTFDDPQVPHVMGSIDPDRDREIIDLELEIAGIKKPTIPWINSDINDFDNIDRLIKEAYKLLDLATFYTIKGGKEVHAWSVKEGSTALSAAERVHTDFAKNFIKAEAISVDELLEAGSWKNAKEKGWIRAEGKDYVMKDGDVVEFLVGS